MLAVCLVISQMGPVLPDTFKAAADEMFAHGMADPRGGELREVVVEGAGVDENGQPYKATGWVMPGAEPRRFVGADGLVYRVKVLGQPVDVMEWVKPKPVSAKNSTVRRSLISAPSEGGVMWQRGVFVDSLITAAALLYRFGEPRAAATVLESSRGNGGYEERLKEAYSGALRGRAFYRYTAGDWGGVQATTEFYARESEFLSTRRSDRGGDGEMMTVLAAEAKRRRESSRRALDTQTRAGLPVEKQVEELIWRLEDETEQTFYQEPQGPVAKELIRIGEAAVPGLIDALEKDKRATRTISTGNGFRMMPPRIVMVAELCDQILRRVLASPPVKRTEDWSEAAPEYRAFWNTVKRWPAEDRAYGVLEDDSAGALTWGWAAQNIVAPRSQGGKLAVSAERRRALSALLVKRIGQVGEWKEAQRVHLKLGLFGALREVDRDAAGALAKDVMQKVLVQTGDGGPYIQTLEGLTVLRLERGDKEAAGDYVKAMTETNKGYSGTALDRLFRPMILYPEVPEFKEFARTAFRPDGPWAEALESPMSFRRGYSRVLLVSSYREAVVAELKNKAVKGSGKFDGETFSYELNGNGAGGKGYPKGAASGSVEVRVCDLCAMGLDGTGLPGAPEFRPYWGKDRRDAAIRKWIVFLEGTSREKMLGMFGKVSRDGDEEAWVRRK